MIAPEASDFALDSAFFVSRIRIAKAALVTVMRTKGDKARRLLAPRTAKNAFDRCLQIVIAKPPKNSAEMLESLLVSFEKRRLRRPPIRPVNRRARSRCPQTEELQDLPRPAQLDCCFIPVNLRFGTVFDNAAG